MKEPLTESGLKKSQSGRRAADRRSEEWRSSSFELKAINRANTLNRAVFRLQMSDQSGMGGVCSDEERERIWPGILQRSTIPPTFWTANRNRPRSDRLMSQPAPPPFIRPHCCRRIFPGLFPNIRSDSTGFTSQARPQKLFFISETSSVQEHL